MLGLLWDSASNNIGDQAIGVLLQRILQHHNLPFRPINPFGDPLDDIAGCIIGGGEIIRPTGHPFYDVFRLRGQHILNTVGVTDGQGTEYLADYRLVSVRSQMDQAVLGRGGDSEIVPCLTLLYGDYLPDAPLSVEIPANAIGIHVHYDTLPHLKPLVDWLRQHSEIAPIVWLPITLYNADDKLLRVLADLVPNSIALPSLPPDEVFRVIGCLRGFISSSLHGTFFAYAQGIPFVSNGASPKIRAFVTERNMVGRLFTDVEELKVGLTVLSEHRLPNVIPDADQARCRTFVERMVGVAQTMLAEGCPSIPYQLTPANRAYHTLEMARYYEAGDLAASLNAYYMNQLDITIDQYRNERIRSFLRRRLLHRS